MTTLSDCHPQYPFLKNQAPTPSSGMSRYITRTSIQSLDAGTPAGMTSRNHAQHDPALANLGEGNIVALVGYLYFVQDTGAESTNCQLDGAGETDFHVGIGFNRSIAQGLQDGHTLNAVEWRRLQQTSVVVEMTPHYRAQHKPQWTVTRLQQFIGRQVKVVGQLMLDNDHINPSDDCADSNADEDHCWRMTARELHPVIRFYIGTTTAACPRTSSAWQQVGDLP